MSRVGVDGAGHMYVPGSTQSEMAAQLGGQSTRDFVDIVLPRSGRTPNARNKNDEITLLQQLLQERGVASPVALQRYAASMTQNQRSVARWALQQDRQ